MSQSKRILITGASGLLGRHILEVFKKDSGWKSQGLTFSRVKDELRRVDLTNQDQVFSVVKEFKPSIILHSAAERRPDVVEHNEDQTENINIKATQFLCQAANKVGAAVIFISTDYVFDGKSPPYQPSDTPNPLNKYGLSKARGEKTVLAGSAANMVLRVPLLYGDVEYLEESAVTILFKKVKDSSSPAEMNHNERRYPTFCSDVAKAVKVLAESHLKDPEVCGIFHWSGLEMMTKYDIAVAMAKIFRLPADHLKADTQPALGAPRPFDCFLDSSRLEALGAVERTPVSDGLASVLSGYVS